MENTTDRLEDILTNHSKKGNRSVNFILTKKEKLQDFNNISIH